MRVFEHLHATSEEEEEEDASGGGSSAAAAQRGPQQAWLPSAFPRFAAAASPASHVSCTAAAASSSSPSRRSPFTSFSSGAAALPAPSSASATEPRAAVASSPDFFRSPSSPAAPEPYWPSACSPGAAFASLPLAHSSSVPSGALADAAASGLSSPAVAPVLVSPHLSADSCSSAAASSYWASSSSSSAPATAASCAAAKQRVASTASAPAASYWASPASFPAARASSCAVAAAAPAAAYSSSESPSAAAPVPSYWASASSSSFVSAASSSSPSPAGPAAAYASCTPAAAVSFPRPAAASYWASSSFSSSPASSASSSSSAAAAAPADQLHQQFLCKSLPERLSFNAPPRPASFSFSPLPLAVDHWPKQQQRQQQPRHPQQQQRQWQSDLQQQQHEEEAPLQQRGQQQRRRRAELRKDRLAQDCWQQQLSCSSEDEDEAEPAWEFQQQNQTQQQQQQENQEAAEDDDGGQHGQQQRERGTQDKGRRRRREAGPSVLAAPVVSAYITNLWAYVDICPRGFSRQQMYLIARSFRCSEYSSRTAQAVLIRMQRPACTAVLAASGRLSVMGGLTQQQAVWQAFRIAYKLRYRTLWRFCEKETRCSKDLQLSPDRKKRKQQEEEGEEEEARPESSSSGKDGSSSGGITGDCSSDVDSSNQARVLGRRWEAPAEARKTQQGTEQQPAAGLQQHKTGVRLQREEANEKERQLQHYQEKEEEQTRGLRREEGRRPTARRRKSFVAEGQQHVENEELRQSQLKLDLRHKPALLQQYALQYVCDPSIQFLPQQVHVQQMVCCLQLRGCRKPHPDVNKIAKHPLLAGRVLQTKDGISIKIPLPPRLPAAGAIGHSPSSFPAAPATSSSTKYPAHAPAADVAAAAPHGGGDTVAAAVPAADAEASSAVENVEYLPHGAASSSKCFAASSGRTATAAAVGGGFFPHGTAVEEESDVAAELFAGLEETSSRCHGKSSGSAKSRADLLLLQDGDVEGDAVPHEKSVNSDVFFGERDVMRSAFLPTERQHVDTSLLTAQGRNIDPAGRPAAAEAAGGTCVIYRSSGRGLVLGCRTVEEINHVIRFITPALYDA